MFLGVTSLMSSFDLSDFVPVGQRDAFTERAWDRAPAVFKGAAPQYLLEALSHDRVDQVIASHPPGLSLCNARDDGGISTVPSAEAVDMDALLRRVEQGASLVVGRAERQVPVLGAFCRALSVDLGCTVDAALTLTPPKARRARARSQSTGVFLTTLSGDITWVLAATRQARPLRLEQVAPAAADIETTTIATQPGDIVYIPRGWPYFAHAGQDGAISLTLNLNMSSWAEFAGEPDTADDAALRDLLPVGWRAFSDEHLSGELSKRWGHEVDVQGLAAIIEQARINEARRFAPDIRGRLSGVLGFRPVELTSVLGARRDLIWHIIQTASSVRLITGPLTLDFPANVQEALRMCLTQEQYDVHALPGRLKPEESLQMLNRLLRLALVYRHQ